MVAYFTLREAGDEVAGFDLGLAAGLHLIVPGEAANLPGLGKEADVEIEGRDAQFAVLDATVRTFGLGAPGGG